MKCPGGRPRESECPASIEVGGDVVVVLACCQTRPECPQAYVPLFGGPL